jgi:DNA invertase Pin-like site-specific DNA recombinase
MRAALYARVSTKDKDQNPEAQLIQLRAWAGRQGYAVVEYVDHASGKDLNRPEWKAMQREWRSGRLDAIAVTKMDRAFRSAIDMHMTTTEWHGRGIRFAITTMELDTATAAGRLMRSMLASFAQFERELISERIKEGMAASPNKPGRPRKVGQRRLQEMVLEYGVTGAAKRLGMAQSSVSERVRKTGTPK